MTEYQRNLRMQHRSRSKTQRYDHNCSGNMFYPLSHPFFGPKFLTPIARIVLDAESNLQSSPVFHILQVAPPYPFGLPEQQNTIQLPVIIQILIKKSTIVSFTICKFKIMLFSPYLIILIAPIIFYFIRQCLGHLSSQQGAVMIKSMHQQLARSIKLSSVIIISYNFYLMGNCCFQPVASITSIEEHFSNNNNAINQNPTDRQLLQAVVVQEKQGEHPEVELKMQEKQKHEEEVVKQTNANNQQENERFQVIISLFILICKSYSNHDVDSCIPYIKQMFEKITILCKETDTNEADLQRLLQQYINKHHQRLFARFGDAQIFNLKTIKQIQSEHADILHYEEQIKSGSWQEKSNKNGSRLCTRNQGNSVGVLIEMDLQLPFEILISILTEIDLYPQFIAFNEVSKQEKIFSRNCRIGYNLNNYPFLSKRQAFFQGIGYSRLKTHGQVFLFTRSIHDKPDLQEYLDYKVKINPDYVQLTYKYFVVKYRPIRKGLGKLTMALNADIGLGFLPNFILQYLAKDFAKQFLQCIIQIGTKFSGSQWEKKVQKNPALFDFFKKQIEQQLKQINDPIIK